MIYKILVVEDENKLAEMVADFLKNEGYKTEICNDGLLAIDRVEKFNPDLIILDIMLPGMNGLDISREVRNKSDIPIIMLTAKAEEIDKLLGLELGADDYLTKPFSLRELAARIKVILRRIGKINNKNLEIITKDDLKIDLQAHTVKKDDKEVDLTPTEFSILTLLAQSPGRVFSRGLIVQVVLGEAYLGYERTIDSHISNLRKKVEDDPTKPQYIITVFGIGYKFGNN